MTTPSPKPQTGTFSVACSTYPNTARDIAHFPVGQSLADALGPDCSDSVHVAVGGISVPRNRWHLTRPREGVTVNARVIPRGGEGGKILRTAALVALMIYAPEMAAWLTAPGGVLAGVSTGLVAAGIGLVGELHGPALQPAEHRA